MSARRTRSGGLVASFLIAFVLAATIPGTGSAATTRIIQAVNETIGDGHWDPAMTQAEPGDTLIWRFGDNTFGHNVSWHAGMGTPFTSGNDPKGDYVRTYEGGIVFFRCTVHSSINPETKECGGMCGIVTDRTQPPVPPTITSPANGSSVYQRAVTVSGVSEPWTRVRVMKGETDFGTVRALGDGTWSKNLFLDWTSHTVKAIAIDEFNRESQPTTSTFTVVGEGRFPNLVVTTMSPAVFTARPWLIQGTASDDTAVQRVVASVSNAVIHNPVTTIEASLEGTQQEVTWQVDLSSFAPGAYYVVISAFDPSQNRTQAEVYMVGVA